MIILTVSTPEMIRANNPQRVDSALRKRFIQAESLCDQAKYIKCLDLLKKVIDDDPRYLQAHIKYLVVKGYFLGELEQVRSEYEALITKNPTEPIYPAALATALFGEPKSKRRGWFEQVVKLAPEWAWSRYAKAFLIQQKDPEAAVAELTHLQSQDPNAPQPYKDALFLQRYVLRRNEDAIKTAERMTEQPELRAIGLSNLWELCIAASKAKEDAKEQLRRELSLIEAKSKDVRILGAVRKAFKDLLQDKESAARLEARILKIDRTWYQERSEMLAYPTLGEMGPYGEVYAGHQLRVRNMLPSGNASAEQQMPALQNALSLRPDNRLKRIIYQRLIDLSIKAADKQTAKKYFEALLSLDSSDPSILTGFSLLLADEPGQLSRALIYVRKAENITNTFDPGPTPQDVVGDRMLSEYYSHKGQLERHNIRRAEALSAHGWILSKMGRHAEAEVKLRESITTNRSEKNLWYLSKVLAALNRTDEAERTAFESRNEYASSIRGRFRSTPIKDFELSTIDGRKIKLSDLKGKVVMLNFWATWCSPCAYEIPAMVNIYNKFKNQGLEILGVSVDDADLRPQVLAFTNKHGVNFPIFHDSQISELYNVTGYPTSIFIGKQGVIRYQYEGFNADQGERDLTVVIEELLKEGDSEKN